MSNQTSPPTACAGGTPLVGSSEHAMELCSALAYNGGSRKAGRASSAGFPATDYTIIIPTPGMTIYPASSAVHADGSAATMSRPIRIGLEAYYCTYSLKKVSN